MQLVPDITPKISVGGFVAVDPPIFQSHFSESTCKQITIAAAQSKLNHSTDRGFAQTKVLDLLNLESCFNNVEAVYI